jgi:2-polyprenyl-6-methoxyphenol hydroxylase-like FAD-dependent oxidoreductase
MTAGSDVLVVGAGTTGLAAALQAVAHGATVRIVDRRAGPFRPSRAMMLHARALECLRPLGVTADLLERADTAPVARLHVGQRVVQAGHGRVDLPDTAFPHLTLIRQAEVEGVLCSALEEQGVRVEWGVEFVGHNPVPSVNGSVGASLRGADGRPADHQCRFIAGCDGQSSVVRHLSGAQWRGAPYRVEAVLADVELGRALEPGVLHVAVGDAGLVFLFALGEGAPWRMLATRPAVPGRMPCSASWVQACQWGRFNESCRARGWARRSRRFAGPRRFHCSTGYPAGSAVVRSFLRGTRRTPILRREGRE